MRTLLHWLSLRHWKQHPIRSLLTVLGVSLGVAVTFSVNLIRDEIVNSHRRSLEHIAGKAQLTITSSAAGIDRSMVERVARFPGVAHVDPLLTKNLVEPGKGPVMLMGVDFLGDDALRELEAVPGDEDVLDDPISFLNSVESVVVPQSFVKKRGLRKFEEGEALETCQCSFQLVTSSGLRQFVIRGILKDQGAAKTFGGDLIVMYMDAAQVALGMDETISSINLSVQEGSKAEDVKAALQKELGDGVDVDYPTSRGAQLEEMMEGLTQALGMMAFLAVWVGILLAYNAVEISVRQRQRELSILRAIGAERRSILYLILLEALVLGVLATVSGVALGYALGQGGLASTASNVSEVYALVKVDEVHAGLGDVLLAVFVGLFVPVIGAFRPANWIAKRSPVLGLTRSVEGIEELDGERRNFLVGVSIVFLGLLCFSTPYAATTAWVGHLAQILVLLSSVLWAPPCIAWLLRLVHRVFRRRMSAEAMVAVDHVIRDRRRASLNIASLVVGVATVVTIATYLESLTVTYRAWLDAALPADLYISSGHSIAMTKNVPLLPEVGEKFTAMPEVDVMMQVRIADVMYRAKPLKIISLEVNTYIPRARPILLDGDLDLSVPYSEGNHILISENIARREGIGPGSLMELKTPSGLRNFKVQAVIVDFSSDQGVIVMDRKAYVDIFKDPLVDTFDLFLKDSAKSFDVQQRIRQEYGEKYNLFVLTNKDFKAEGLRIIDDFFQIVKLLQFVTLLIAVLGVTTTLIAAVLDRTQEVAVMRAVGSTPGQILRIVLTEAGLLGGLSSVIGIFLGNLAGFMFLKSVALATAGWSFPWQIPWMGLLEIFIAVTLASLVAGIYPALWIAKQPTLESMSVE